MTIEVRQLIIRSQVVTAPPAPPALPAKDLERLRQQILAECRALVAEQLRQPRER